VEIYSLFIVAVDRLSTTRFKASAYFVG